MRIALVAGEASGDLLGAGLVEQLRRRWPNAHFVGIGGDAMRAAGTETWFDASEPAVMGLSEVLRHLPRLLPLRRELRQRLLDWQPDVFIGIDAPDFNLGVERWLKQRRGTNGLPRTVHYVSPSVWAWREKRAEKIGLSAARVLCLGPAGRLPAKSSAAVPRARGWRRCRVRGSARSSGWPATSSRPPRACWRSSRRCRWWRRWPTATRAPRSSACWPTTPTPPRCNRR